MSKKITPELLVKHLYHETTTSEAIDVEQALNENRELYNMYINLQEGKSKIPFIQFNPPISTVSTILDYSQSMLDLEARV